MALGSQDFNRPKLAGTLTEGFTPIVALADDGENTAIVDFYVNVNSTNKTLVRVKLEAIKSGTDFKVGMQTLAFPGNATTYSAGGETPADAAATASKTTPVVYSSTVDLDAFYTAAGDTRANS